MVMQEKRESLVKNAKLIGSGETTVVLAHGYGGDQTVWDYLAPELAERFRVAIFDWNFHGVGENSKQSIYEVFCDDVISWMDTMDMKKVVFVGHSMSGMVGCLASVKRPDLFRHLILLCASPRYLNSEDYEGGLDMPQVETLFSDIVSNFQTWATSFADLVVGHDHPSEAAKFLSSLLSMGADAALSIARHVFLSDFRLVLEHVEVPCAIVNGPRDFVIPYSVSRYMQGRLKGESHVEAVDFDGHFPQLTAPRLLADVIFGLAG